MTPTRVTTLGIVLACTSVLVRVLLNLLDSVGMISSQLLQFGLVATSIVGGAAVTSMLLEENKVLVLAFALLFGCSLFAIPLLLYLLLVWLDANTMVTAITIAASLLPGALLFRWALAKVRQKRSGNA